MRLKYDVISWMINENIIITCIVIKGNHRLTPGWVMYLVLFLCLFQFISVIYSWGYNLDDDSESILQSRYRTWNTIHTEYPHYDDVMMGTMVSQVTCVCLFRRRSKKTAKLCVTAVCEENPPVTSGFPSQMASDAEYDSNWWRHHGHQSAQTASFQPHRNSILVE